MKVAYPVIFTDMDTNILIEVPDLGILTEANEEGKTKGTIADAIMMARDAIGISCIEAEDRGDEVPILPIWHKLILQEERFMKMAKAFYHWLMLIRQRIDDKRSITIIFGG